MMTKKLSPFSLFLSLVAIFSTFYSRLGKYSANLLFIGLFFQTTTLQAFPTNQCPADRKASNIECTANDVNITRIDVTPSSPKQCTAGDTIPFNFLLTLNFAVPDRWDVGVFLVKDGKDPHFLSSGVGPDYCTVGILPLTSPFLNLDGAPVGYPADTCGDGNGYIGGTGGTDETNIVGEGILHMNTVPVKCQTNPLSDGRLAVPFVVTWDNQATPSGGICNSINDPVPNTVAKCNSPNQSNAVDVCRETVAVVVMPQFSKTGDKTVAAIGDTITYTVTINNNTGGLLQNIVFKDPAVNYLTITEKPTCVTTSTNGCPTGLLTVANMQNSGVAIPNMTAGSTMTFTIKGKISGSPGNGTIVTNKAILEVTSIPYNCPSTPLTGTSEATHPVTVGASPKLTLTKTVTNTHGGTATSTDFILSATGSSASISGVTGTPAVTNVSVPGGSYVLSETMTGGLPVTGYLQSWVCTAGTLAGSTLTLSANQNATCTLTNDDSQPAYLTIRKITKGYNATVGVGGPFTFSFTANGPASPPVLSATTTLLDTAVATTRVQLAALNTSTKFTETQPNTTWVMTGVVCRDKNGATTGNGNSDFSVSFDQTTNTVTIPAANIKSGAELECDVTNSRRTLRLTKLFFPTGDDINLLISTNGADSYSCYKSGSASVSVGTHGTTVPGTCPQVVSGGDTGIVPVEASPKFYENTETTPTNLGSYDLAYSCSDGYRAINSGYEVLSNGTNHNSAAVTVAFDPLSAATPVDHKQLQVDCVLRNTKKGYISVTKTGIPADTQTFNFTSTVDLGLTTAFSMNASNDGINNKKTASIKKDTGTITESSVAGWELINIACYLNGTAITGNNLATRTTGSIAVGSAANDIVDCTFTNRRLPKVTVTKNLAPTTDAGKFNLVISGSTVPPATPNPLVSNATHNSSGNVTLTGVGSVTISETAGTGVTLSDYNTSVNCVDSATNTSIPLTTAAPYTSATFTPTQGQQVSCTFTNKRKPLLTVVKTVASRAIGSDEFTVSINNGGTSATTPGTGSPETKSTTAFPATKDVEYTFQEVGIAGADLSKYDSTYTCTNTLAGSTTVLPPANSVGTSVKITPKSDGDNITCTFTNTAKPASVKLTKTTLGGTAGAFNFNLTNTTQATGAVTTAADGTPEQVDGDTALAGIQNFKVSSLNTAIDITESALAGWSMTSAGCSGLKDTDKATVDLPNRKLTIPLTSVVSSAEIECNFTNSKNTTVTVKKTLTPNTNPGRFDLKINGNIEASNVGDGGVTPAVQVTPGSVVTVSEEGHVGTILANYTTSLTCTDTTAGSTIINAQPVTSASFIPTIGHAIQCTFTNSQPPKLKLAKKVVGTAAFGDAFNIAIKEGGTDKATATVDAIDTYGTTATFTGASSTSYTFTESASGATNLNNYTTTFSCTNNSADYSGFTKVDDHNYTVTPADADNITCTFTNTAKTMGTITLTKALAISRVNANDQFTVQIKNSSNAIVNSVSNSTTIGTASTVNAGTGTGSYTGLPGTYTLTEVAAGSTNLADYKAKLTCTNKGVAMAAPYDGSNIFTAGTAQTITLAAGDNIACTLANGNFVSTGASLAINKTTIDGFGSFEFKIKNGTAAESAVTVVTSTGNNPKASTAQTLNQTGATTITETIAAGWTITSGACTDDPAKPNKWLAVKNVVTIPAIDLAKTYTCNFKNTKIGPSITGTVFKDSGTSSGTANDGIKNGGETGIAKVTVKLTDCAAAPATVVYSTAVTDAGGNYSLSIPDTAIGKIVCVEETNLSDYISTGSNVNDSRAPTDYTLDTVDKIHFKNALVADTSYSNLNFGDVPDNSFLIDGTKTGRPGATVFYPHTFTAGSTGKVTFSLPGAIANPAISGWSELLYKDNNCDGVINTAAGDVSVVTTPATEITVAEGDKICLILKEFIPANAPMGASNLVKVQANFVYTNATPALTATYTRQDLTKVSDVALDLLKMVRLDGTSTWLTSNTAKSGQVLEYQITYTNNAATVINNLVVNDATPAYTTFVSATCPVPTALPANLTNCTVSSSPSVGSTGGIKWIFTGTLAPGASGTVTFKVKVD